MRTERARPPGVRTERERAYFFLLTTIFAGLWGVVVVLLACSILHGCAPQQDSPLGIQTGRLHDPQPLADTGSSVALTVRLDPYPGAAASIVSALTTYARAYGQRMPLLYTVSSYNELAVEGVTVHSFREIELLPSGNYRPLAIHLSCGRTAPWGASVGLDADWITGPILLWDPSWEIPHSYWLRAQTDTNDLPAEDATIRKAFGLPQ